MVPRADPVGRWHALRQFRDRSFYGVDATALTGLGVHRSNPRSTVIQPIAMVDFYITERYIHDDPNFQDPPFSAVDEQGRFE